MERNEPWKLVKTDKDNAGNVLYHCAESLRLSAILLSPIMPTKTEKILENIGCFDKSLKWGKLLSGSSLKTSEPIFPRIN